MSNNYNIEMVGDITFVRFIRKPDPDDLCQSIDAAAAMRRSGLRLWDFSECDVNLTSSQLEEVADYAKTKFSPPSKVAIVAAEDLSYGLSRIYEALRTQEGIELEVFRTQQKALDWLKTKTG